jgi:UDP-N-acetylglucosamine:LPS N-acetylglucosamine transferase
VSQFADGLAQLRADPATLASMRIAAARLARPDAADRVASQLAELADVPPRVRPAGLFGSERT